MTPRQVIAQARNEAQQMGLQQGECLEVHCCFEDGGEPDIQRRLPTDEFIQNWRDVMGESRVERLRHPCIGLVHDDGAMLVQV